MKLFKSVLLVCFVVIFSSCSNVKTSIAPVVDSQGRAVFAKPKSFNLTPKTKSSKTMIFLENILEGMPEGKLAKDLGIEKDSEQAAQFVLSIHPASVQEKGKRGKTGVYMPIIAIKHVNVPQASIDSAMPKIQRDSYNLLKNQARMIPVSSLVEKKD